MNEITGHNLGPQPIIELMEKHNLKSHDLVALSRSVEGVENILNALNAATEYSYKLADLFTY